MPTKLLLLTIEEGLSDMKNKAIAGLVAGALMIFGNTAVLAGDEHRDAALASAQAAADAGKKGDAATAGKAAAEALEHAKDMAVSDRTGGNDQRTMEHLNQAKAAAAAGKADEAAKHAEEAAKEIAKSIEILG
jgi:hypothetical protein